MSNETLLLVKFPKQWLSILIRTKYRKSNKRFPIICGSFRPASCWVFDKIIYQLELMWLRLS